MILTVFFILGFIQSVSSIQCLTCQESGFFCSLPLNLDGGDESNEHNLDSARYNEEYVCMSDHYFDSISGTEKLVLRGVQYCEELNVYNHRRYCCNTDHCNKWLPPIQLEPVSHSNIHKCFSSMILMLFSVILSLFQ